MTWPVRSSIERLLDEPHRYSFFQALRLLDRWLTRQSTDAGGMPSMGGGDVLLQRVRFRNSLSLAFPASEIEALKVIGVDDKATAQEAAPGTAVHNIERIEITPAFIGFLGSSGALPAFYTELFAEREQYHRDGAARAFLDIFLQRTALLFYRAWRKHRLALHYERDRRLHYLPMVLSLAGVGQRSLQNRLAAAQGGVGDNALAFYVANLRQRPVSASVIQRMLAQYFNVPVAVDTFVGRWFALPPDHQCALGLGHATLGGGAVVGQRVWQRDLRLRLTLGPMRQAKYSRFLPGGVGALALKELILMLTGLSFEYEVRLALHAEDVRPAQLASEPPPRLGLDSFLMSHPSTEHRSDAGYDLLATA